MLAAYNNNRVAELSNDQLYKKAPSIFASKPAASVSDKYVFIPTLSIVDSLREEGFYPVAAGEARARKSENLGFTKHIVRFRKPGMELHAVGDVIPEIILGNAHNGLGHYTLDIGGTRLACLNGLVVSGASFGSVVVAHRGKADDIIDNVIEGVYEVISQTDSIAAQIEHMQAIRLERSDQLNYARAAAALRWNGRPPIDVPLLLDPRRTTDKAPTMWNTYNVVQENAVKGGLAGKGPSGRATRTRSIKSAKVDFEFNKALWGVTNELVDILG